jgi:hypothetical protein
METNNPVAHRIVSGRLELPRQPRFAGRGKIQARDCGKKAINLRTPTSGRGAEWFTGGAYIRGREKGTGEGKRDVTV